MNTKIGTPILGISGQWFYLSIIEGNKNYLKLKNIKMKKLFKGEKYSDKYYTLKVKFEKADSNFDSNPTKKTASKLSNARIKFNNISDEEKYSHEYQKYIKSNIATYRTYI